MWSIIGAILCSKNEDTKSESNSQRLVYVFRESHNCVQRTKIQNLKAIHNIMQNGKRASKLCSKNEDTKSESNSQHFGEVAERLGIVFKERRYKIWKQFTTDKDSNLGSFALCSKNEDTKSESNSQQSPNGLPYRADCVQRTKIQNLKAIHNRNGTETAGELIVFKERRYKIWKQFTTVSLSQKYSGPA